MTPIATARRILASGDVLTGTNAELRAILEAYVEAEAAIRELQQAACDRDGVPMPSQRPVVERLREALAAMRALVKEGGVPRYTVTPGAALNSVIEELVDPALATGQKHPLQGQEE